jgi:hypothetical protein
MSPPTDRSHEPSFGARTVSFAHVSEAARALAASQAAVHIARTMPNLRAGSANWDLAVVPERDQLLNPDSLTASLPVRRRSGFAVAGLASLVVGVGLIAVLTNTRFPPAETWKQFALNGRIKLASLGVPLSSAMQDESAISRLIAQSSHASSGEPAPLGLTVRGPTEGAVVVITGLLPGMDLSTGHALGGNAWQVPAIDLAYAWVGPPKSFVGSADLVAELRLVDDKVADRQVMHIEWLSAISSEPAQRRSEWEPIVQLDQEEIIQLDREDVASVSPISPAVTRETNEEIGEVPISPKHTQRPLDQKAIKTVGGDGNLRTSEGSPSSEPVSKEVARGVSSSEGVPRENTRNAARDQDHRGMAAQRYPGRSDRADFWTAPPYLRDDNRHAPSAARTRGRAPAPKGFWNWSW